MTTCRKVSKINPKTITKIVLTYPIQLLNIQDFEQHIIHMKLAAGIKNKQNNTIYQYDKPNKTRTYNKNTQCCSIKRIINQSILVL